VSRARRYNPDLSEPPASGSPEDDENLREFVKEADAPDEQKPQRSSSRRPMVSVPVCGVTMTSDTKMSVQDVAQVRCPLGSWHGMHRVVCQGVHHRPSLPDMPLPLCRCMRCAVNHRPHDPDKAVCTRASGVGLVLANRGAAGRREYRAGIRLPERLCRRGDVWGQAVQQRHERGSKCGDGSPLRNVRQPHSRHGLHVISLTEL